MDTFANITPTTTALKITQYSDRLIYCTDCLRWDASRERLERCKACASPRIHQAYHAAWARRYVPQFGCVYHGSLRIAVSPDSLAAHVLSLLKVTT